MKPARSLLILLGIFVGLGCAVGGLMLTPAVQRWAVLRAVRAQPGLKFDATTIAAGLSSVRLEGARIERSGLKLQIGQLETDYSLWQLVWNRRLVIGRLTARGLVVDASKVSRARAGAVAAGAPAAAPGLLARMQLPFALTLGECRLDGRALLPGSAGSPPVVADFKITGGQIAPGQEGALQLATTLANPAPAARVATLRAELTLRVRQTAEKTFSHIGLVAVVDAEGRNLPEPQRLKIAAELAKSAAGETYEVNVDTLIRGAAEKVLALHATIPAGGKEYAGEWRLLARTAQAEPFFLGLGLPDFTGQGEGRFTFNPATAAASLQGNLTADISRLEAINPAWRPIGAVKAMAQFDVARAGDIVRLNQFNLSVAGANPVLELAAAPGMEIDLKQRRLLPGDPASDGALTLTLQGLPVAWIRPFVQAADVSGGLITGQLAGTGDAGHLVLRTLQPLRIGQVNIAQAGRLLLAKADVMLGLEAVLTGKEFSGHLTDLTLKTAAGDVLSAQARVVLPAGPNPAIAVLADYQADLPSLLAPWLPLGRIKASGGLDFTLAGKKIELRQLNASLTDATGLDLFKVTALRHFNFDLAVGRAEVPGATGAAELLRVSVAHLPLAALPLAVPGARLGGFVTQGDLVLTLDGEKLSVHTPTAIKLAEVSLGGRAGIAFTGLSIEARPDFESMGGAAGAKFQTGDITVRTAAGAMLFAGKGEATYAAQSEVQGALTFAVEVPALASQPLFTGARTVSAGRASGEVRVAFGAARQLEARMTVNGLVLADSNELLPVANLSLRAVAGPDGKISVQAPLLLDRAGQRSDLDFTLDLTRAGRGYAIDGQLAGQHVELADAISLLSVFLGAAPEGAPPAPATTSAGVSTATVPLWSRFTGRLALDVKSVTRGADWAMTGLTGLVVVEPADITLQQLAATFGEKGRFAAKALVSFTPGSRPYELTGDLSLTEFDAGKLFKALEPAKAATVEGVFAVDGKFSGRGETLERAVERSHGTFELTSRQGVFRGLQRTTNKVSLATKAVDLVGTLFGSSRVVEKVVGTAFYVDQLAQTLGELNYDQLNLKLVRDGSLNVTLDNFSLVSPEIRLLGQGKVTHVAGKSLLEQPLQATLSLSGRGRLEEQLGKLRLLSGARDELDYAGTKEAVTLGGTLARPDPTPFFTRLATGKISDLLTPDN